MYYITPRRFRTLGTGVDLSGTDDVELAAMLESASVAINAACAAPDGYSFLGGLVVDEAHQWKVRDRDMRPNQGRVWPYMRPVLDVSEMRIKVTRDQQIIYTDNELFFRPGYDYVEPTTNPATISVFAAIPPYLLTSPVAYVDYSYGWNLAAVDDPLAQESGGSLQGGHQFWLTEEDVELKKNGTVVDPSDYTVDYDEGLVTPDSPDDTATWKASYHYRLPPGITAATSLVATDQFGYTRIAAAGLLGLSGIKVEEVELRQSSKVNYAVTPVSPAAQMYLGRYKAMFMSMR